MLEKLLRVGSAVRTRRLVMCCHPKIEEIPETTYEHSMRYNVSSDPQTHNHDGAGYIPGVLPEESILKKLTGVVSLQPVD